MSKEQKTNVPLTYVTRPTPVPLTQTETPNFEEMAGQGLDQFSKSDMQIPFLSVLQSGSEEVKEDSSLYIEGATPGQMINSVTKKVVEARKSKGACVEVIPLGYVPLWMQWRPKKSGGGISGRHETEEILKKTKKGGPRMTQDFLENGDEIILTYYWTVLTIANGALMPVILPLKKTALKQSRKWATLIKNQTGVKSDGSGDTFKLPLWARYWKISTIPDSNDAGTWYIPTFEEGRFITNKEFGPVQNDFKTLANDPVMLLKDAEAQETQAVDSPY